MKLIRIGNVYDVEGNEFNSYCWINPEHIVMVYPSTITKLISTHYVELSCTRIEMIENKNISVNATVEDVLKTLSKCCIS